MAKVTTSNFPDILSRDFEYVRMQLAEMARPSQAIFNMRTSDRSYEKTSKVASGGYLTEKPKGDSLTMGTVHQGYDKTWTHLTYGMYYRIEYEVFQDDDTASLSKLPRSLALSAVNTEELLAMTVINNGFTDTGPDGTSCWATDHPKLDGGTFANKPSTDADLSPSLLRTVHAAFQKLPDDYGIPMGHNPSICLVSPEEELYARELYQSTAGLPDSANNNLNPFLNKCQVVASPLLSDTDATYWFADKAYHEFVAFIREAPNVSVYERDFDTDDLKVKVRMRCVHGYGDGTAQGTYATSGG